MQVVHRVGGVYGNLDTEGGARGVRPWCPNLHTDNEVYNQFKLCVNNARSPGLCSSPCGYRGFQQQTRIRTNHDEEDKLLLAASQVYEIESAIQREGMRQRCFKYSSPGIIINCLNPLESVYKINSIKAHPRLGWVGGLDLASGNLSLIKMHKCASMLYFHNYGFATGKYGNLDALLHQTE